MNEWMYRASCIGMTKLFYSDKEIHVARAKAICVQCPVRADCLDYALAMREDHGVWGGLNEQERLSRHRSVRRSAETIVQVTYTTNARSTGATCSAGRSQGGWSVVCRSHGDKASASSRTVAEFAVSRPEEWCDGCHRIAAGEMPKLIPYRDTTLGS